MSDFGDINSPLNKEDSLSSCANFMEEILLTSEEVFNLTLEESKEFFNTTSLTKRTAIIIDKFEGTYDPKNFAEESQNIGIHHTSYAFTRAIVDRVFTGTFSKIARLPESLQSDWAEESNEDKSEAES